MNPYLLPALLALLFKMIVLIYSHRAHKPTAFTGLIYMLAALNLCEILGYLQIYNEVDAERLLRVYYSTMFFCQLYLCLYSVEVVGKQVRGKALILLVSAPIAISIVALFTDYIISGTKLTEYSIEAIKGHYYWIATASIAGGVLFTAFTLGKSMASTNSAVQKTKSGFVLFALSPLLLVSLSIIVLRLFEINANSAMVVPIATTAFLLIVVWGESKYSVYDIRRWLPYSHERRFANQMIDLSYKCSLNEIDYRDAVAEFETQLLKLKLRKSDKNVTAAAETIGVNRSSIYSMMTRLGFNKEDI